jgi:hypothetical protein
VREAAAMQLAKAAKADDTIAVSAILDALKDFTPKVRESASASLVSMTTKGDENIIAKVSQILENDFKDIRDCAFQVTLHISTAERAVEVVGRCVCCTARFRVLLVFSLEQFLDVSQFSEMQPASAQTDRPATLGRRGPWQLSL